MKPTPKVKPAIAYAIVNRKNPKIDVSEVYGDREVAFDAKTEKLIKVRISAVTYIP